MLKTIICVVFYLMNRFLNKTIAITCVVSFLINHFLITANTCGSFLQEINQIINKKKIIIQKINKYYNNITKIPLIRSHTSYFSH